MINFEKNFIRINLQLFGEKTEDPTQKKIDDTRKKGQVAQSKELTGALTLFVAVYSIKFFGSKMFETLVETIYFFNDKLNYELTKVSTFRIILFMIIFTFKVAIYIIIPVFIVAIIAQRGQVGQLFTFETIRPKFSRLNPLEGLKRMFSMQSIMNLLKSLLKITLVGYVGFSYIKDNISLMLKSIQLGTKQSIFMLSEFSVELSVRMAAVILLIGIFDYFYQRYSYNKNLKMSKQEVKEEYKNSEGDPQVKSKIKQRQREASQRRMMQQLPEADVIITNPTHFAVAIKYDEEKKDAPYVLAKGKDLLAQKIKEIARELEIPIIENKPLARQMYKDLELGDVIPANMYEAVAEILAYVYSLKVK